MHALLLYCFAFCVCLAEQPAQSSKTTSTTLTIDGSKTPDLIPEYLVWRHTFQTLDIIKERKLQIAESSLALTEPEVQLVLKEVVAQRQRDSRCRERQEKHQASLEDAGASLETILRKVNEIVLECRVQVLEARDRLMAELSFDAQVVLAIWANERRAGIRVFVPKDDIDFFRKPR